MTENEALKREITQLKTKLYERNGYTYLQGYVQAKKEDGVLLVDVQIKELDEQYRKRVIDKYIAQLTN